jgi:NitT/TauT family transport system permease protein
MDADVRGEALRLAMPWLVMAALLIVWEVCCVVFDVPEIILPRPSKVFIVFYQRFDMAAYAFSTSCARSRGR